MSKKNKKEKKTKNKENKKKINENKVKSEIVWLLNLFFVVFVSLSVYSHDYLDPSFSRISSGEVKNYFGLFGSYFSDILFQAFGVVSYLIPIFFPVYFIKKQFFKEKGIIWTFAIETIVILSVLSGLLELYPLNSYHGGIIGALISYYSVIWLNKPGATLILVFLALATFIYQYEIPLKKLTIALLFAVLNNLKKFFGVLKRAFVDLKYDEHDNEDNEKKAKKNKKGKKEKIIEDYDLIKLEKLRIKEEIKLEKERKKLEKIKRKKEKEVKADKSEEDKIIDELFNEKEEKEFKDFKKDTYDNKNAKGFVMYSKVTKINENDIIEDDKKDYFETPPPVKEQMNEFSDKEKVKAKATDGENGKELENSKKTFENEFNKEVDDEIEIKVAKKTFIDSINEFENLNEEPKENNYKLPPLEYLKFEESESSLDQEYLMENARLIVECLADFGINDVKVKEIFQGPTLTTYELEIKRGIQISKVIKYTDEIAAMLKVSGVRMISIPQKGVIGVEVPNKKREIVWLKEIIASKQYQKESKKSKLTVVLGKDISGEPVIANLAKMPHLLIAGTTGSGKSVFNNVLITSILYNATPDEVKFILIDPKMLEFSLYNNIPNLLFPVIIDPKKAAHALNWAVDEMERRYKLIADNSERDIVSYNNKMKKYKEEGPPKEVTEKIEEYEELIKDIKNDESISDEEKEKEIRGIKNDIARMKSKYSNPEILPYIVIVLDEYADLMMVAGKNVEISISRIAQKARAAGIHLVIATQRPDKDVVTGIIKANLPVRVALSVKGSTNSKIILDSTGAEKLLGHGDLLYLGPGTSDIKRIQSPLITSEEQKKILDFLREQGKPTFSLDLLNQYDDDGDDFGEVSEEDKDVKYEEAVKIALEMKKISASYLQRRLKLGYNRAARIVEVMEKEGIVGPPNGSKPRKVIISEYEYKK